MSQIEAVHERFDAQTRAVLRCAVTVLSIVLIGTLGFRLIETQWSLWDSFYFTLVTITTVGYGDYGISKTSQIFAAFLLLCGIGTFTYSLSTLIQIASDVDAAMRRKMKSKIAKCNGHIIVCGYGRIGRMICKEIERGGMQCVVVERDADQAKLAMDEGRLVIEGIASEDEVLLQAGIRRAQGIVCAVDCDAENMFITVSARDLNPECRVISRAESKQAARKLEQAGASMVISPHQMAGKTIATAFLHPRLTRFLHTGDDSARYFELSEVEIEPGSGVVGETVAQFGAKADGVVFVAIERTGGELIVQPRGDTQFHEGDVVIFAGSNHGMDWMRSACGASQATDVATV